jgi:hypothetical protein
VQREAQRPTGTLDGAEDLWMNRIRQIPQKGYPLHAWTHLAQQVQPLLDRGNAAAESRDVSARLCPVRDNAEVDRVTARHEHDRNLRRRPLRSEGGRRPDASDDDGHPDADELRDESGQALEVSFRGALLDAEATPLGPPAFGQTTPQRIDVGRRQRTLRQKADRHRVPRPLRLGGERRSDEPTC